MSATHDQPGDQHPVPRGDSDGQLDGDQALDFFEEVIWTNRDICSECFERIRGRAAGHVIGQENTRYLLDDPWRTENASIGHDVIAKTEIGERATRNDDGQVTGSERLHRSTAQYHSIPRTTCESCGSVGATALSDPLSRREALQRVDHLVARLEEYGYEMCEPVVRQTIRHLKAIPEYASRDKRIFATAVALGVDRA